MSESDFAILRPGIGLNPEFIVDLVGKEAKSDLEKDEPATWRLICGSKRGENE